MVALAYDDERWDVPAEQMAVDPVRWTGGFG